MHILHVVGARPNFMKAAPVWQALAKHEVRQTLVHTGQHYDDAMSDVFFRELELPAPDENLGVGSGTHAQQTAAIISSFEGVLLRYRPTLVAVYGDVNSTLAAAVVAAKLNVAVAHVEAGLRSFDRSMPEEINRIVTDHLASLLFTPSSDGNQNLEREGISSDKIHLVGNVMIDTLVRLLPRATAPAALSLPPRFVLVTLHRPANVDDPVWLGAMVDLLREISGKVAVLFPVHPRTRQRIKELGREAAHGPSDLRLLEPVSYLEILELQRRAALVMTDSGGMQEETTFLGVPCLTLRENTERPVTVTLGTNQVVGRDIDKIKAAVENILGPSGGKQGAIPPLWDGNAGMRIADVICRR